MGAVLRQYLNRHIMAKNEPHEVTIFRIYDERDYPGPHQAFNGCLDPISAISAELPPGSFLEAVRKGQRDGEIDLDPGHYLILEFSEDIEEFMGMVFTVTPLGIESQCLASHAIPKLSSWPPKRRRAV